MVKYINYGHPRDGIHMYVISMFQLPHGSYRVEISPCDIYGKVISDAIEWDVFPSWWEARRYARKKYKELYKYVNHLF